ncbi:MULTISPECIES: S49 family peptidase [unclassified Bradyrhizobium]|uniref:S49 family peptidase n=1 Tax=unclassified Bradyrhizobium TaxID=2631580 RepID=UPI0028EA355A|nr:MULTISPECIES: S49 family peptidase [unclassified Bradyrhizobium]
MSNVLVHIADRVLNRPLMILPDKLALIASVLEGRIGIDATELKDLALSPEASRFSGSYIGADGNGRVYRVDKGVAMIQVLGSLVNRGAWIGARSGMTSYEGLAFQLAQAAADPEVKSVVLDIDSPGGEAVGAFEMADRVRAVGKSKPVVAVINGMAASAAYAIASAATQIVASPSGVAGSIGVVLMHADYSNALHQKGVKPTLIHAGAHKVDGNPYEPLSADVRAGLQAEVDNFYSLFVSSVAQGRKGRMTEKAVRATEARTYIGQAAVDAGLVDAIGSFETVLADLSKSGAVRNSNPKRASMDKTYTQAEFDAAVTTARAETTNAFKAEFDKATTAANAAGLEQGRKEGVAAERERINGIVGCEEAKGRSEAALNLALKTDTSLEVAKTTLAVLPKAAAGAPQAAHGLFLTAESKAAQAGAQGDYGWGDIAAKLNKQNAR